VKAAQEKAAIESDSDKEAEMRAERDTMKAGAVRVNKCAFQQMLSASRAEECLPSLWTATAKATSCIAQQGAGSRWFCWVARVGPVRQRCYGPSLLQSARHHLCLQVTGQRNKNTRFVGKKAQWSVVSVTEAGGMKVVGVSQKTPVTVDAVENPPTNIRFDNFCIQLMI